MGELGLTIFERYNKFSGACSQHFYYVMMFIVVVAVTMKCLVHVGWRFALVELISVKHILMKLSLTVLSR